MRTGRKPKPTNLKILQGNKHKERINLNEPKFDKTMPECPAYLTGTARKIWKEKAKELHGAGVLTVVDNNALATYCALFSRFLSLEADIKTEGTVVVKKGIDKNGEVVELDTKINPKVVEARLTVQQVRQISTEFGMTPSSRSRIQVGSTDTGDEVDEFLKNCSRKKPPRNIIKLQSNK